MTTESTFRYRKHAVKGTLWRISTNGSASWFEWDYQNWIPSDTLADAILADPATFECTYYGRRIEEPAETTGTGTALPEGKPTCPQCSGPLEAVTYPGGYLNEEQWDSQRAGDWVCRSCPDNGRAANKKHAYFWKNEVTAEPGALPPPERWNADENPNAPAWSITYGDVIRLSDPMMSATRLLEAIPVEGNGKQALTGSAGAGWLSDFEKAFQLVFLAYGRPATDFDTDAGWAMWMKGRVTEAFGLMQKVRASLPPPPADGKEPA